MTEKRLFSDSELERMGLRTVDAVLESIQRGNLEEAAGLAKRMYGEFLAMHDLYRNWVTHLLTFIGQNFGDKALAAGLRETVNGYTSKLAKAYEGKGLKAKVKTLCAGIRGHLHEFRVTETDEEIILTPTQVCGSGGRLVIEGAYEGPDAYLKIAMAQEMTFGRSDFPVYCAHCYFQNTAPAGTNGEPLYLTEPAENLGKEPCKAIIPK